MKANKPMKQRLEDKPLLLFQLSLIVALSLTIMAFKLNISGTSHAPLSTPDIEEDAELAMMPIVEKKQKARPTPPKPKPKPKPIRIIKKIKVVAHPFPAPIDSMPFDSMPELFDSVPTMADPTLKIEPVIVVAESMPSFPGGYTAMAQFLADQTRYPEREQDMGLEGTVFVQFIVEKDGSISTCEIVRKSTEGFNQESLRVIQSMPNWNAGEQNGKKVRVRMTLPIRYRLN